MSEGDWSLEALSGHHLRESFDSGDVALDDFLKKYARQNEQRGLSRTYVIVRRADPTVLGYHTLRMGAVAASEFPEDVRRRLPRYPVPVVHLARLAVDRRIKGQGLGALLLAHALEKALLTSRAVAAYAVEVIAKTEEARSFYLRFGFHPLRDDRLHLYLSMKTVERMGT